MDSAATVATAQRLHDELNRLEVAGLVDEQGKYFAEDVLRLDPNRAPQRGREPFLRSAHAMRDAGYRIDEARTQVMNAWMRGDRLVEYGTTTLTGVLIKGGAPGTTDPVNYMAVWRINPATPETAQIEAIIWNTQQPMAELTAMVRRP